MGILAAASAPAMASPATVAPAAVAPSPPDPDAAEQAAEANLESPRSGFRIALALGASMQLAAGLKDGSGAAGGASLRVGTAIGPRLAWLFDVTSTGFLRENAATNITINRNAAITLGLQWHLADSLWVRGGAGLANFSRPSKEGTGDETLFTGYGAVAGGGYDVVRRGGLAVSAELSFVAGLYPGDGLIGAGLFGVGLGHY